MFVVQNLVNYFHNAEFCTMKTLHQSGKKKKNSTGKKICARYQKFTEYEFEAKPNFIGSQTDVWLAWKRCSRVRSIGNFSYSNFFFKNEEICFFKHLVYPIFFGSFDVVMKPPIVMYHNLKLVFISAK